MPELTVEGRAGGQGTLSRHPPIARRWDQLAFLFWGFVLAAVT